MRLHRRPAAVVFVSALLLAGCGGDAEEPVGLADASAPNAGTSDEPAAASAPPTTPGAETPSAGATVDAAHAEVEVDSEQSEGADAEIVAAYVTYWETAIAAASVPDPDHEGLEDFAADPQLERVVSNLESMRDDGERFTGTFRLSPSVVSVTGPVANLTDCTDGSDSYHVDPSGEEVPDSRGSRSAVDVELLAESGGWVVADIRSAGDRECPE